MKEVAQAGRGCYCARMSVGQIALSFALPSVRTAFRSALAKGTAILLTLLSAVSARATTVAAADTRAGVLLERDFIAFDPDYRQERSIRDVRIHSLAAQMYAAEAKGIKNSCGHQILFEAEELMITSAHFQQIDKRLNQLDAAILHPSADGQDAEGMWGNCTDEWYLKLYDTYDRLEAKESDDGPLQPLPVFLNRVSTPEKLVSYLDALSVSDVRTTGVDRGLAFNQTLSIPIRMLVLGEPQHYRVDPALRDAFMDRLCIGIEIRRPPSRASGTVADHERTSRMISAPLFTSSAI